MIDRRAAAVGASVLALACGLGPGALADSHNGGNGHGPQPTQCIGTLGPVVVPGDVVVPAGQTCELLGTRIFGSVDVQISATLSATGAFVGGGLECDQGSTCALAGSTSVQGDVAAQSAATFTAAASVLGHDLTCAASCQLSASSVGHDVTVPTGGTFSAAASTTIRDRLQCADQSCTLDSSTVKGDVTVASAGSLTATSSSFGRDLVCGASCNLTSTSVGDDVVGSTGGSFSEIGSTIGDDVTCPSGLCTFSLGTVRDDVTVPAGGTLLAAGATFGRLQCGGNECQLGTDTVSNQGTHVFGDVSVSRTGRLDAEAANVGGSVNCSGCQAENLYDSTVRGDVFSAEQAQGGFFCNNTINGSFTFTMNNQFLATCGGNHVGGNMTVSNSSGELDITGNVVGFNLTVLANHATINIDGNTVGWALTCPFDRPPPQSVGNQARFIDPACNEAGL